MCDEYGWDDDVGEERGEVVNYVCMWDCGEEWFERSVRGDGDIYNCMYSNTLIIWECAHMSRPSTRTNKTKQNKNKVHTSTWAHTRTHEGHHWPDICESVHELSS